MFADETCSLPALGELVTAYQSAFYDERTVISVTLVSRTEKMRKQIVEYLVRYQTQQGEVAEEALMGKVYSDAAKGKACYELMAYLWASGMCATPEHTIVQPLAYFPAQRMFLMAKAPGKTFQDVILAEDGEAEAASQIAILLSRLHALPANEIDQAKKPRLATDMTRFICELEQQVPDHADQLHAFYKQLMAKMANADPSQPVLLHGDFHPKNIFVDQGKVTAIDFDQYFIGDSAWDVAYLASQIQLSAFFKRADFHLFDPIVKKLIDTYLDACPSPKPESFLDRLHLYRARSLFESLHYEVCVCRTEKREIVPVFLAECWRSLERKGLM